MSSTNQSYRKKQALLMVVVFVCLAVAIWGGSLALTVGGVLAACGVCFWAASLEPEKSEEEHHH
jgi:hypothetical protein